MPFEFDDVVVDAAGFRVVKAGRVVALEPKAVSLLIVLLERAGDLVRTDELLRDVWAGTSVTPNSVTRLVALLRRALGDNAGRPRYIETIRTRGYRFIAPLHEGRTSLATTTMSAVGAARLLPTTLPARVTPLVGRGRELQALEDAWSAARLVVLVGPAGIGKTQLALEHARRVASQFRDGVGFVDLASTSAGADVNAVVSLVLDLTAQPQEGADSLARMLRPRHVLLVLDNCEHLVEGCARLAASLLRTCPDVHILATSQQPFGIAGESVVAAPPLEVPAASRAAERPDLSAFAAIPSVELFVTRARAVRSSFELTTGNMKAVGDICRRLDGIPLAIELAAAHVNVLSAGDIAARLDDRLTLLAGGRSGLARHRTLAAAMEWSLARLTAGERALLSRLSVFAGGWSFDAAASICTDDQVPRERLFALMAGLIDKSFVVLHPAEPAMRYSLLETIRLYAHADLRRRGGVEALRLRHFRYYVSLARRADRALIGPDQVEWLNRLDGEDRNLAAALELAIAAAAPGRDPLRLAVSLRRFWWYRSRFVEARDWLTRSLAAAPRSPKTIRAHALLALACAEQNLSASRAARAHLRDGTALLSARDYLGRAFATSVRAVIATGAREASTAAREGLRLARRAREPWVLGFAHVAAGLRAGAEQRHANAARSFALARRELSRTGDRWLLKFATSYEALQRHALGDQRRAAALASEALTLAVALHDRRACSACLEILGYVAVTRQAFDLGARLMGAADALRDATGVPLLPSWRRLHTRAVATLARRLPAVRETWKAGRTGSLQALVAEAGLRLADR
jgi:non-specific serine/threonine protein kinase